jgi:hypothetical protein
VFQQVAFPQDSPTKSLQTLPFPCTSLQGPAAQTWKLLYAIHRNKLSTAIISNKVASYLRGSDGDLLREGVALGVDLGVESADRSPGGRESCRLRRVSFSSGTANSKQLNSEHTAYLTEHTAYLTEHTAYLTEHTAYLTEHTAYLTEHTAYLTENTAYLTTIVCHFLRWATLTP